MREKIDIVADFRERPSACFAFLERHVFVDLKMETLPTGDYKAGACLIERKSVTDLAASLVSGRLFNQAARLMKKKHSLIIIEGHPETIGNTGVSRFSLQGAIITLTLIYGIPVLYALEAKETAALIVAIAKQTSTYQKETACRFGYLPKSREKRQLYILQGFPGIGAKRAKLLLKHFGTVRAVMNATTEELHGVKGIGIKRASLIENLLAPIDH